VKQHAFQYNDYFNIVLTIYGLMFEKFLIFFF